MGSSFKKGFEIGLNCFLGSYTIIFLFYILGIVNILNLYIKGFYILEFISLILCIYNSYWLSKVVTIRKSFRKNTLEVLTHDKEAKKSDKYFVADLIFTIFWKDVYAKNFQDEIDLDNFIKKLVLESIVKYNEGDL
jgi:hypothetical protein